MRAWETITAVIIGAFTVAIIAVVFSQRAQTPAVLQAGGSALSSIINAAVSPLGASNQ